MLYAHADDEEAMFYVDIETIVPNRIFLKEQERHHAEDENIVIGNVPIKNVRHRSYSRL